MRLIDSEKYYQDLQRRSESIKEDSVMKQGMNHGRPADEGRYIVQYDGKLIEGFFYKGVLYEKKVGGKSMVRLVPDRVGGWVTWPKEQ